MRRQGRIVSRITGIVVVILLFGLGFVGIRELSRQNSALRQLFAQKEDAPVLEKSTTPPKVIFENVITNSSASVLGTISGNMFWKDRPDLFDSDCYKFSAVNGCKVTDGDTIVLKELMFQKSHHGLQFFDGTSTSVTLKKEEIEGYRTNAKGQLVPIWKVTETSPPFKYCTGPKYESLAMISLGPISWPTVLMGQELSTFRATGDDGQPQYAVIDPTGRLFDDFKPEDIIKFCKESDKAINYTQRTIDIFNAAVPGYNLGPQMIYSIRALCTLASPDSDEESQSTREAVIKALWQSDDIDVKKTAALIEVEQNLGRVEKKFHEEIEEKGLMGYVPNTDYIGMMAWQTKDAGRARIANSTGASKMLYDFLQKPGNSIKEQDTKRDVRGDDKESTTIMSAGPKRQYESTKPTIIGAISGGVYYMDESVLNGDNLAMLSWDPNKLDADTYFCNIKGNEKRCPVVRAIGGCSSEGYAQTDVRLRQLTLAAVNDTQRWATSQDDAERTTNRTEDYLAKVIQAPDENSIVAKASIDDIILASGKGSVVCAASAVERQKNQEVKLTEEETEILKKRLESAGYKDQAVLVTPVRINYRTWALYDVNKDVQNDCYAWVRENTGPASRVKGGDAACKGMDPDNNGYNVTKVEKWGNGKYLLRGALISFNIATYYRGQSNFSPADPRITNFKEDLRTRLASQHIYEFPGIRIDCGIDATGVLRYWICRESDNKLLPKCDDGSGTVTPEP